MLLTVNQPSAGVTTCGHCLKLQKRDCRTSLRANVLVYRIVNFWNASREHFVTAVSAIAIKSHFDRHCSHLCYCTEAEELCL